MKHRSVIAFVIVAVALFSLPQLSHDLQALKGAVGARLHNELLHAFLNLPAGEPTAAAPVARPAETLLASCSLREKLSAPAAKSVRAEGTEGRGKSAQQSAMIGDPAHDPINQMARVEINEAADKFIATLPEAKVETEVAMIVPPEHGLDLRGAAAVLSSKDEARIEADKLRVNVEGLRVAYVTAASLQANNAEWRKETEAAFRKLNGSLHGTYEFRVMRDGSKAKVLKLRCNNCPTAAPPVPRAPRPMPVAAPLPPEWAGE